MRGGRFREVVAHGGSTELGNQGNTTLMAELHVLYNQAPLLIFELPPPPPPRYRFYKATHLKGLAGRVDNAEGQHSLTSVERPSYLRSDVVNV